MKVTWYVIRDCNYLSRQTNFVTLLYCISIAVRTPLDVDDEEDLDDDEDDEDVRPDGQLQRREQQTHAEVGQPVRHHLWVLEHILYFKWCPTGEKSIGPAA